MKISVINGADLMTPSVKVIVRVAAVYETTPEDFTGGMVAWLTFGERQI